MVVKLQFAGDYFADVTLGLGIYPPRRYVMSAVNQSQRRVLLAKFKEHVVRARYGSSTVGAYVTVADHFLQYLSRRKVPIQEVCTEHVSAFLGCVATSIYCTPWAPSIWRLEFSAFVWHPPVAIVGKWALASGQRPPVPVRSVLASAVRRIRSMPWWATRIGHRLDRWLVRRGASLLGVVRRRQDLRQPLGHGDRRY